MPKYAPVDQQGNPLRNKSGRAFIVVKSGGKFPFDPSRDRWY